MLLGKAASGHLPSIRYFFTLYHDAVRDHFEAHREGAYEYLETLERSVQLAEEPVSRELLQHLNRLRVYTRELDRAQASERRIRGRGPKRTRTR